MALSGAVKHNTEKWHICGIKEKADHAEYVQRALYIGPAETMGPAFGFSLVQHALQMRCRLLYPCCTMRPSFRNIAQKRQEAVR